MRARQSRFVDVLVNGRTYCGHLDERASIVGADYDLQTDTWVVPWLLGAANASGFVCVQPDAPDTGCGEPTSSLSVSVDVSVAGFSIALELTLPVSETRQLTVMKDMTLGLFSAVAMWQAIAYSLASAGDDEDGEEEVDNMGNVDNREAGQVCGVVSRAMQQRCGHILDRNIDAVRDVLAAELPALGSVALAHSVIPMRARAQFRAEKRRKTREEQRKLEERGASRFPALSAPASASGENASATPVSVTPIVIRRRRRGKGTRFSDSDASSEDREIGAAGQKIIQSAHVKVESPGSNDATPVRRGSDMPAPAERTPLPAGRACARGTHFSDGDDSNDSNERGRRAAEKMPAGATRSLSAAFEAHAEEPLSKRPRVAGLGAQDTLQPGASDFDVAKVEFAVGRSSIASLPENSVQQSNPEAAGVKSEPYLAPVPNAAVADRLLSPNPSSSQPRPGKSKTRKKKKKQMSLF